MTDVGTEYVLLREAAVLASENQLNTRPLDVAAPSGEPILVGLDTDQGKHLLLPLEDGEKLIADTGSRGVWLIETRLIVNGTLRRYADLLCREESLELVFERLVEDVVRRVTTGQAASTACHLALDQWRAMLRSSVGLAREEILGVIGELEILRILGANSPAAALGAWTGPRRTVHDFVSADRAIEVKATSSVDGATVSINGLDQVDPVEVGDLHLAVVHCKEDLTAPTLDDRIHSLIQGGFPRNQLLEGVERSGYLFEAGMEHGTQYSIKSIRLWQVDDDFPGLRRSTLPEAIRKGVSRVKYDLAVDSAPPRLTDEQATGLLGGWLDSND